MDWIRSVSLLCILLIGANIASAQNKKDDKKRKKAIACTEKSDKYNESGKIKKSIKQYKKSICFLESLSEIKRSDLNSTGLTYNNLSLLYGYLGDDEEVVNSLISSYDNFVQLSEPRNLDDKVNQINTLKSLLFNLLNQGRQDSEMFDKYLADFSGRIDEFRGDRNLHNGYSKYLKSIQQIQRNGFSEFDQVLFDTEKYSAHSLIMKNEDLKYISQKKYLVALRKMKELSEPKEKRVLDTHLVSLLGSLSYWALFQSDYKFSEQCALEVLDMKMNQWWVATNLMHSLYLQNRLEEAKEVYYLYRNLIHTDGKTLGALIVEDISVLESKDVCDSKYRKYVNGLEEDIIMNVSENINPRLPILCGSDVTVSTDLNSNTYEWRHTGSGSVKKGKTTSLDQSGMWVLSTIDYNSIMQADTVYVDDIENLKYFDFLFRKSNFMPVTVFRNPQKVNEIDAKEIAFSESSVDFVQVDSVAKYVVENFKTIRDLKGESLVLYNSDLCTSSVKSNILKFIQFEAGLLVYVIFHKDSVKGKMYVIAKDRFEVFPIVDERTNYNQLFYNQSIIKDIIESNDTEFDIARVIFSNMFMGHAIGGWR